MEFLLGQPDDRHVYTRLGDNVVRFGGGAFRSGILWRYCATFRALVPARRKHRPYISSILAKNEVHRDDKYNRKLFRRLKHGHYIIQPQLAVWVEAPGGHLRCGPLDALGKTEAGKA